MTAAKRLQDLRDALRDAEEAVDALGLYVGDGEELDALEEQVEDYREAAKDAIRVGSELAQIADEVWEEVCKQAGPSPTAAHIVRMNRIASAVARWRVAVANLEEVGREP